MGYIQFNSSNNRLEYVKVDKKTGAPIATNDVSIGVKVAKLYQPLNER